MTRGRRIKIDTPLSRVLASRTGKWLIARLEDFQEKQEDRKADPGWFHPSSLAVACDAALAFQFLGVPAKREIAARTRRILDNGHNRDQAHKRYLHEAGLSLIQKPEERFVSIPEHHIRGEIDDAILNPLTKEKYIFEFKTINSKEFKELASPMMKHVIQVHPYMYAYGVQQTYFLYECKDDQSYKEFVIRFDAGVWASITVRLENVLRCLRSGMMPTPTPIQAESQCGYRYACAGFSLLDYMRSIDERTRRDIGL